MIYEIYPQSFADTNGDGIGDLAGVIEHLDYLAWLGVDAIWFNPCFASPFRDAGYDVSDYLQIAPRYGSNDDMVRLLEAAADRGIRVVLDLVAGHTSSDHPWFQASMADPSDDRYIWADRDGPQMVPSPGPRPGWYYKNFYDSQPALNFGYARMNPDEPWRQPVDAAGPQQNRAALREIMAFWFDKGVAGFRVDMAFSLVKDDPGFAATAQLWRELRGWLEANYPDKVIIPEGVEPNEPGQSAAFHADFFLVIHEPHLSLFDNHGAGTLAWTSAAAPCFFEQSGRGSPTRLIEDWTARKELFGADRLVLLASADHDFSRLASGTRTPEQHAAAWVFLLTWGSVPSIYYGDEIAMRYQLGLPDKEGSAYRPTYNRSGARTPMQWDPARPNAGFSTADPAKLYLPIDPDPDRPTVAGELADETSNVHLVQRLIALRRKTPELRTEAPTRVLNAGYPFVYLRGDTHLVVVNPRREAAHAVVPAWSAVTELQARGIDFAGTTVRAEGFSYGIFEVR